MYYATAFEILFLVLLTIKQNHAILIPSTNTKSMFFYSLQEGETIKGLHHTYLYAFTISPINPSKFFIPLMFLT